MLKPTYSIKTTIVWFAIVLCALANTSDADADDCAGREQLGHLQSVSNDVRIVNGASGEVRSVGAVKAISSSGMGIVCSGDELKTGEASQAFVYLHELNALVRLDAVSVLGLTSPRRAAPGSNEDKVSKIGILQHCRQTLQQNWLQLKQGALRLFTTRPQELDITTEYLNASIEGTEFGVVVTKESTRVDVTQGRVLVCNREGSQLLNSGESGESKNGEKPVLVDSADAVQWAVYFPALADNSQLSPASLQALELANLGRMQSALELISSSDSAFDLSLRAMIHVALGQTETASILANRAVQIDPAEATTWLSLSYVQQSEFQLNEALSSIGKARQLAPQRSDLWVREVELLQINGFGNKALSQARLVVARFPDVARGHAAVGFLQLYNYQLEAARRSFEASLLLDESDPMPRLGLGLSYMRQGNPARAKLEIEIAVNLNPLQSTLRSYLSRVYLELGLLDQALEQIEVAIALDVNDPLPLLFSALLKQEQGNPPAALAELSKSVGKVASRAVYRSVIEQDTDMAVVLSSRARIYEELGFQQMTLLDGAESVQSDPGSYVAHRLLADAYLNRPRLEFARRSELLQSQMRQPLSNNPGQFRLFDSRLGSFRESGPFALSFNEYTRLFTREGLAGRFSILAQSLNTRGVEGQLTQLKGNTLGAVSGYLVSTDGLDINRDERLGIFSGFIQHRFSSHLDVQFGLEYSRFESGDDYLSFNRNRYFDKERNRDSRTTARISANFRQTDTKSWLFNIEHGRLLDSSKTGGPANPDLLDATDGQVVDVQNISYMSGARLMSGLLLSQQHVVLREINAASDKRESRKIREVSLYSYLYKPIYEGSNNWLDAVIGLSYDRNNGRNGRSGEIIGPKLGLSGEWHGMRFRAVGLRSAKRSLIGARSLEPTQLMGFSQSVDEDLVDNTSLFGVGLDRLIYVPYLPVVADVNIGSEFQYRRTVFASNAETRPELLDYEGKIFLYVPMRKMAALVDWSVIKRRARSTLEGQKPLKISTALTHRLDLGVKWFWSNSLSTSLTAKWRQQNGEFFDNKRGESGGGQSSFWTVDLAARWKVEHFLGIGQAAQLSIGIDNVFDRRDNFEDIDPLASRESYQRTLRLKLQSNYN